MTLPEWLQTPWALSPPLPEDDKKAGACLKTIFGWKNGLKHLSAIACGVPEELQDPITAGWIAKRISEHQRILAHDTLLETLLARHFESDPTARAAFLRQLEVFRKDPKYTEGIRANYALPENLAASIFTSQMAMHVLLGRCDNHGRKGEDVEALRTLTTMLPRLVIVGKVESLGSGVRKWLAITL